MHAHECALLVTCLPIVGLTRLAQQLGYPCMCCAWCKCAPRPPGVPAGSDTADERVAELQQEVELLRQKIESHPEVKRFAGERQHAVLRCALVCCAVL